MTRTLVYEDEYTRRFEIRNQDGELVGIDEESKSPPDAACPTCGRAY